MKTLRTTLGNLSAADVGMILPHEHIFVDLRTPDTPGYAQAEAADVVALMKPEIEKIKALGVTVLVECTPTGVGRRADLDRAVSEAANFPVIVPTGVYREPWIPAWMHDADEQQLYEWMLGELQGTIESSGVQAGWIKLSAGDDGITPLETKILRAAARAGAAAGAIIGSHTIKGRVVKDQLAIIEEAGYTPERFISIHSQAEPDIELNLELARRGVWLEYDGVGNGPDDDFYIDRIRRVLDAGFGHRMLLSHDRGWFDPAKPGGGTPMPFTYINQVFLPKLRNSGIDDATIHQLTHVNPFEAFAR